MENKSLFKKIVHLISAATIVASIIGLLFGVILIGVFIYESIVFLF